MKESEQKEIRNINDFTPTERYFLVKILNHPNLETFYNQGIEYIKSKECKSDNPADRYFKEAYMINSLPARNHGATGLPIQANALRAHEEEAEAYAKKILEQYEVRIIRDNHVKYSFFNPRDLALTGVALAGVGLAYYALTS